MNPNVRKIRDDLFDFHLAESTVDETIASYRERNIPITKEEIIKSVNNLCNYLAIFFDKLQSQETTIIDLGADTFTIHERVVGEDIVPKQVLDCNKYKIKPVTNNELGLMYFSIKDVGIVHYELADDSFMMGILPNKDYQRYGTDVYLGPYYDIKQDYIYSLYKPAIKYAGLIKDKITTLVKDIINKSTTTIVKTDIELGGMSYE